MKKDNGYFTASVCILPSSLDNFSRQIKVAVVSKHAAEPDFEDYISIDFHLQITCHNSVLDDIQRCARHEPALALVSLYYTLSKGLTEALIPTLNPIISCFAR